MQCALELLNITLDDSRIDADGIGSGKESVRRELTAQGVEQLLERVPGVLRGALGREPCDELVAAESWLAGRGEQRQQGEPAPLESDRLAVRVGEREAAESLKPEHEPLMRRT